jgi:hypothetical protein
MCETDGRHFWKDLFVTSWIHTLMYDVDFGGGRPKYVEGAMPKRDELVQLMGGLPQWKRMSLIV